MNVDWVARVRYSRVYGIGLIHRIVAFFAGCVNELVGGTRIEASRITEANLIGRSPSIPYSHRENVIVYKSIVAYALRDIRAVFGVLLLCNGIVMEPDATLGRRLTY